MDRKSGRERRTWRLTPPPLSIDGQLEGWVLLEESPTVGGALWLTLRSVTLWANTPVESRTRLFAPSARAAREAELAELADPVLRDLLGVLSGVLTRSAPADGDFLAEACAGVAAWASAKGLQAAHAEFIRAAAVLDPDDAARCLAAGRAERDRGAYSAAEAWLQRCIGLARRAGEWDTYARAHLATGMVYLRRGKHPVARKFFEKSIRAATRHGHRVPAAMAHHELFTLSFFAHRFEEGQTHAAEAARLFGPGHPGLRNLAFDVAYQWLEQERYSAALPVLVALGPLFTSTRHRTVAAGALAWAAGALNLHDQFREAADEVFGAPDETPDKAAVLVNVARGASRAGDLVRARRALTQAERLAKRYNEARVLFLIEPLRDALASSPNVARVEQPPLHPHDSEADDGLSVELTGLLEAAAVS